MNGIVNWLMQPILNGSTILQAILLIVVLVVVILCGIKMFEEFIKDYRQLQEEDYDEEDL